MINKLVQVCFVASSMAVLTHALSVSPKSLRELPACSGELRGAGVKMFGCHQNSCASRACPEPVSESVSGCNEAIEACSGSFRNVRGLFILGNNSVYRTSDVLRQVGQRWRSDSLTIMCDPKYRNTFLRDVLKQTTSLHKEGQSTIDLHKIRTENDFERTIAANQDAPRLTCATGVRGPGGIQLGNVNETDSESIRKGRSERINLLAQLVEERSQKGLCEKARPTDLVVPLRMGDYVPQFEDTTRKVTKMLASNPSMIVKRIVFSGVLNYGGYASYVATEKSIEENVNVMDLVIKHFEKLGYDTKQRSEPVADKDLCYMATAQNIVTGDHGFARMVKSIRERILANKLKAESIATQVKTRI